MTFRSTHWDSIVTAQRNGRLEDVENPFGLPTPLDPLRPGSVVLHGGGPNQDLIEIFPQLIRKSNPELVHCPAADAEFQPLDGEAEADFQNRAGQYFDVWVDLVKSGQCRSLHFLSCRDAHRASRPEFLKPMAKADGVWFSGGDQAELSRLFVDTARPSPFERTLHDVVARGGLVGGSSAGTAIMARVMIVSSEQPSDQPMRAVVGQGFSLLRNTIIEQHLGGDGRAGRLERFTSLLLNDPRVEHEMRRSSPSFLTKIGLAIEEETWLWIRANRLQVFGANRAHLFLVNESTKQVAWHELHPGDSALLRLLDGQLVLTLDEFRLVPAE